MTKLINKKISQFISSESLPAFQKSLLEAFQGYGFKR